MQIMTYPLVAKHIEYNVARIIHLQKDEAHLTYTYENLRENYKVSKSSRLPNAVKAILPIIHVTSEGINHISIKSIF